MSYRKINFKELKNAMRGVYDKYKDWNKAIEVYRKK